MAGNGLYNIMQPIYGDLGDGLWHCFIHNIFNGSVK